jgi:hypothetical protein
VHDETAEHSCEDLLAEEQNFYTTRQPVRRLLSTVLPAPAWKPLKSVEKASPYKLGCNTMGDAKCRWSLGNRVIALLEGRVVLM